MKSTTDIEELESANPESKPDTTEPEVSLDEPVWNHRSSKVSLAYPVMRDLEIVGPGEDCIDCKKGGRKESSHQFHIRASKVGAQWVGPEAGHLELLRAGGYLRNTPQAAERRAKIEEHARIFGVEPGTVCPRPDCGKPIERREDGTLMAVCGACGTRNGMPELAAQTTAQMRRQWERDLRGGAAAALENEAQLLRADTAELKRSVATMGEGIAEAIKQGLKEALEAKK